MEMRQRKLRRISLTKRVGGLDGVKLRRYKLEIYGLNATM